jgi:hypothetical protein
VHRRWHGRGDRPRTLIQNRINAQVEPAPDGGVSGLGEALCSKLADLGHTVVATYYPGTASRFRHCLGDECARRSHFTPACIRRSTDAGSADEVIWWNHYEAQAQSIPPSEHFHKSGTEAFSTIAGCPHRDPVYSQAA